MAKFFSVDNQLASPNTPYLILYSFKELLKTAGWTHVASGDGDSNFSVTPGNVNDVITDGASGGPNSMANTRAWWIGQQPAGGSAPYSGTRQILLQLGDNITTSTSQRWAYSYSDGFSGGSPDANTPPDFGADVQFLAGGGTPASPSFSTDVVKSLSEVYHIMASDYSDGDNAGFYLVAYDNGGGMTETCFVFHPIVKYSDNGIVNDEDPFVFTTAGDPTSSSLRSLTTTPSNTWMGKGSGGPEAWQEVTAYFGLRGSGSGEVIRYGINHITGDYDHPFVTFGREVTQSSPYGWKGESTIMGHETGARAFRDTFDSGGGVYWAKFGDIILPWNSTTEPLA